MVRLLSILNILLIFIAVAQPFSPKLSLKAGRSKTIEDHLITSGSTLTYRSFHDVLPRVSVTGSQVIALVETHSVNAVAIKALAKLISTCGIGVWAANRGFLDKQALSVLSKLIFNLFQPCLLFVNVATTVAYLKPSEAIAMKILPLVAAFQVAVGYIIGKVMSFIIYGKESTEESRQLLACTSFGNSGPLPLVFVDALLKTHRDHSLLPKSVGYISLYLLGWSPLFWIFGPQILTPPSKEKSKADMKQLMERVISPPVIGSLLGLFVGAVPTIRHIFLKGLLSPVFEAIRTLGNGYLPAVLLVLAGSLIPAKTAQDAPGVVDPSQTTKSSNEKLDFIKQIFSIYTARFLVMPCLGFGLFRLAKTFLPASSPILTDKLLFFIILMELSMPSAQNTTVIMQLRGDSSGAARMARVLLMIYVLGVPAMSFWLAKIMIATKIF